MLLSQIKFWSDICLHNFNEKKGEIQIELLPSFKVFENSYYAGKFEILPAEKVPDGIFKEMEWRNFELI